MNKPAWLRVFGQKREARTDSNYVSHNGDTVFNMLESLVKKATNLRSDVDSNISRLTDVEKKAEEAITVAKGMNKALVCDTEVEMFNLLKDEENKGQYPVGTNIYIIETEVPDRWISAQLESPNAEGMYYEIQSLETKTIDLTNINLGISYLLRALCRSEYSNTKIYSVGDIVRYNYILYKCVTAVESGEDFDESKWEETDLASIIEDICVNINDTVTADDSLIEVPVADRDADTLGGIYTAEDIKNIEMQATEQSSTTTFPEDGSIITNNEDGTKVVTTFPEDGSIVSITYDENSLMVKKVVTTFPEDGSIVKTVERGGNE